MIEVERLDADRVPDAAALFVREFGRLRQEVAVLSDRLENAALVCEKLRAMGARSLMAVENGRLVGYLAWWVIDNFRGSGRKGAYVPEWAHGAVAGRQRDAYRALYRTASGEWTATGCGVHAITLLADDAESREAWFWNGFGLAVVDAARPAVPLAGERGTTLSIGQATAADADALAELDAEHVLHYTAAPVYMAQPPVDSSASFREFMSLPKNSIWLAFAGDTRAGFMRFSAHDFDAVAVLQSDSAAFCNGAYVRPAYRGQRVGVGLLNAALRHYAGLGFDGLFTNFESFNPEAASFWPRYFRPVCFSLARVPEVLPGVER
jgi:GNAT superfamily N-acetyltransferase